MSFTLEFDTDQGTFLMRGPLARTGATTTQFTLTSYGSSKIDCIKMVRRYTDLSLQEAKDLVEHLPYTFRDSDVIRPRWNPEATLANFGEALAEVQSVSVTYAPGENINVAAIFEAFKLVSDGAQ